jgi:hypothetical protein
MPKEKKIIVVVLLILLIIIALSIAGTNTPAYFAAASVAHMKSCMTLTPESNVLKFFYFVTDTAKNRIIIIALSIAEQTR